VWPQVAAAARYAIDIRFRLLDYFYTAFWRQTIMGTPSINPMVWFYPHDANTFGIDGQFWFGDSILVSPVLEENSTSVEIYLPDDIFYDWNNGFSVVRGNGSMVELTDIDFTTIPLYVGGGSVIPLRSESANTTTELRTKPFQLLVAPGLDGRALGSLYLDEGNLIEQPSTAIINFDYSNGSLFISGYFEYQAGVNIETVTILGVTDPPSSVMVGGTENAPFSYDNQTQVLTINTTIPLTGDTTVTLGMTQVYTGFAERRKGWLCPLMLLPLITALLCIL
jgi:alpha-glucosidase